MPVRLQRLDYAFPTQVAPGLDRSHPAAGNETSAQTPVMSAIAQGANFYTLSPGVVRGTVTGTVTAKIDANLGPSAVFSTAGTSLVTIANACQNITYTSMTFAVVARVTQASTGIFLITAGSNVNGPAFNSGGAITLTTSGSNPTASAQLPGTGVNVPFFAAASVLNNVTCNIVVTVLTTGQIITATSSASGSGGATGTTSCYIGNSSAANFSCGCNISAAMFSGAYLPMNRLVQWAQNPWAFWYQNDLIGPDMWLELVGHAAVVKTFPFEMLRVQANQAR